MIQIFSFLIALTIVFGIFSFSRFISISFISSISMPFYIFKSPSNLELLYSIVSIFNPSTPFVSVFNLSISLIFFLIKFINFNSSLILFDLPKIYFLLLQNLNFFLTLLIHLFLISNSFISKA